VDVELDLARPAEINHVEGEVGAKDSEVGMRGKR
jgi:hypothetical protein